MDRSHGLVAWVVEEGQEWRLAEDAEALASQALGVEVRLAALSRRPDLRRCVDWTERVPHLAGNFGAAVLRALLVAGWIERTPGTRALTTTPLGTERMRRTGITGITVDESGCDEDDLCYSGYCGRADDHASRAACTSASLLVTAVPTIHRCPKGSRTRP